MTSSPLRSGALAGLIRQEHAPPALMKQGRSPVVHLQKASPGDSVVRLAFVILVVVAAVTQPAYAQKKKASRSPSAAAPVRTQVTRSSATPVIAPSVTPSSDSLVAISRRGRRLAERDSIAWLGSGAMTALYIPDDSITRLIVRRTDHGWEVASGKLVDEGNTYLLQELATPGMQKGRWASSLYEPAQPTTDYFARAARAVEASITMFQPAAPRRYIAMAVPAEDGPWWFVYVYPSPKESGVWPRGGDMRFRVSADGRVITESRRLHESITEYSVRTARPASAMLDREAPVSGDTPEDTDVFHILQRRPAIPELMLAGKYRYRIDVDGTIRLLPNN